MRQNEKFFRNVNLHQVVCLDDVFHFCFNLSAVDVDEVTLILIMIRV